MRACEWRTYLSMEHMMDTMAQRTMTVSHSLVDTGWGSTRGSSSSASAARSGAPSSFRCWTFAGAGMVLAPGTCLCSRPPILINHRQLQVLQALCGGLCCGAYGAVYLSLPRNTRTRVLLRVETCGSVQVLQPVQLRSAATVWCHTTGSGGGSAINTNAYVCQSTGLLQKALSTSFPYEL